MRGSSFPIPASGSPCASARAASMIKSENCSCVPPEHEHYHLICPALKGQAGFKSGALVVIAKDSDGGYRFVEERG